MEPDETRSEEESLDLPENSEEEPNAVMQHFQVDSDASVTDSDDEQGFVVQEEAHSDDDESNVMYETIEMGGITITSYCSKCGVHLCKDVCFQAYHTEMDL